MKRISVSHPVFGLFGLISLYGRIPESNTVSGRIPDINLVLKIKKWQIVALGFIYQARFWKLPFVVNASARCRKIDSNKSWHEYWLKKNASPDTYGMVTVIYIFSAGFPELHSGTLILGLEWKNLNFFFCNIVVT